MPGEVGMLTFGRFTAKRNVNFTVLSFFVGVGNLRGEIGYQNGCKRIKVGSVKN